MPPVCSRFPLYDDVSRTCVNFKVYEGLLINAAIGNMGGAPRKGLDTFHGFFFFGKCRSPKERIFCLLSTSSAAILASI